MISRIELTYDYSFSFGYIDVILRTLATQPTRCLVLAWLVAELLPLLAIADSETQASVLPQIADVQVGFSNTFKLGYWTPVQVELKGGTNFFKGDLELIVPDSDGVPTSVVVPVVVESGDSAIVRSVVKIGASNATLTINLRQDKQILAHASRNLSDREDADSEYRMMYADQQLILLLDSPTGSFSKSVSVSDDSERAQISFTNVNQLPRESSGYEGVDWVVLSTEGARLLNQISEGDACYVALRHWLENGGRLAMLLGSDAAELMLPESNVGTLLPGGFTEMVEIDRTQALEHYAESDNSIGSTRSRTTLTVPKLENVHGNIEAFVGNRSNELPLVVRTPFGFGETVFAAIDLAEEPFSSWAGRAMFFDRLLKINGTHRKAADENSRILASNGYDDLSGALRYQLSRAFGGVSTVSFTGVTLLVLAYLALIGPIDYFLVKRVFRRMQMTWVTFPAIILLTSLGAYWYTVQQKGTAIRLNQAELVDFDTVNGRARGFVWSALYSPQTANYDLSLALQGPSEIPLKNAKPQLSWLGLPGTGLGGMQTAADSLSQTKVGYEIDTKQSELEGVPIEVWSTKVFTANWDAASPEVMSADLAASGDGLLAGRIDNLAGMQLTDARLLYGTWAWRLGDIRPDGQVDIDVQRAPIKVKTLLTRPGRRTSSTLGANVFVVRQATVDKLMELMMFYSAAGGARYSRLKNSYQSVCDLSHLLDNEHAILIARSDTQCSQLLNNGEPLASDKDLTWTFYRFVLPVTPAP